MKVAVLLLLALLVAFSEASRCTDNHPGGVPNMNPIDDSKPVFVKRVKNGELYTVGGAEDQILLLHLYGSSGYDFGYAAGELIGDEIRATIGPLYGLIEAKALEALNSTFNFFNIPENVRQFLIIHGLDFVLDLQNEMSEEFMDPQIFAEMHGIADATGLEYKLLRRVHYIGEITRGACSYFGAWGNATKGGKTLQLRSFDWNMDMALQNHPVVTIYHPQTPQLGYPFANIGWAGWVGVLTGVSSNQIGISEIGITYPDSTFGDETFIGIPFIFLERQIVQYGKSVFDAMDMFEKANRTCRLVFGVADGKAQTARMVQYSHSILRIFDDTNLMPNASWHPRIPNIVYNGMDWDCPWFQQKLHDQLVSLYGELTPENTVMNVTAIVGTGDLHTAIYDLTDMQLFVANARGAAQTGPDPAYQRQFVKFDLATLFKKPFGAP